MKRFIVFMLVFLCAISIDAQVRNSSGQKVVRQIDVYMGNNEKPYIMILFNYSNALKLEEIVFNAPASGKVVWKKTNNSLTRIEYDEEKKIRKDLSYGYKFENGLVSQCVIDNIGNDKSTLRYSYFYQYNDSNLVISDKRVYFSEKYGVFEELSDRYREVFEWDSENNVFTTDEKGWRNGQMYDYTVLHYNRSYNQRLMNDTNVDFTMLYRYIGNFDRFEMVSEWFGKHSNNLVEKDNGHNFKYVLDNGNLIQIFEHNQFDRLEKTYKICYWE